LNPTIPDQPSLDTVHNWLEVLPAARTSPIGALSLPRMPERWHSQYSKLRLSTCSPQVTSSAPPAVVRRHLDLLSGESAPGRRRTLDHARAV
jgi:hypothetical protein